MAIHLTESQVSAPMSFDERYLSRQFPGHATWFRERRGLKDGGASQPVSEQAEQVAERRATLDSKIKGLIERYFPHLIIPADDGEVAVVEPKTELDKQVAAAAEKFLGASHER